MSSAGRDKNYRFPEKNHWRRTAWNYIVNATGKKPCQMVGLYLGTRADEDWKIAKEKGFRRENCIAINDDQGEVKALRDAKTIAICDDIIRVTAAWPIDNAPQLDFVLADFCCAMSEAQVKLSKVAVGNLVTAKPEPTVFIVNQFRGREGECGRKIMNWTRSFNALRSFRDASGKLIEMDQKHRGTPIVNLVLVDMLEMCFRVAGIAKEYQSALDALEAESEALRTGATPSENWTGKHAALIDLAWRYRMDWSASMRLNFNSYKSRGPNGAVNVMDSVFMTLPPMVSVGTERALNPREIWRDEFDETRKRISAALAIRTRRLAA